MTMQDNTSDMIMRINNAIARKKPSVMVCTSRVNVAILQVLQEQGYIRNHQATDHYLTLVKLKYIDDEPAIISMRRMSKPGRRHYSKIKSLSQSCGGMGTLVLSTPKGVMTDVQARKANVGGEVLCEVL